MPKASPIQTDFSGGEFSPLVFGRVDVDSYSRGLATCENFIPALQGFLQRRSGTRFVSRVQDDTKQSKLHFFDYRNDTPYVLEFGNTTIRIFTAQGSVVEAAKTITGITQADPAVVTSASHGFSNGDWVFIDSISGMTELNGDYYVVANVATNTFELQTLDGQDVDSSGFAAYSSGGEASRVLEVVSPYAESDLSNLYFFNTSENVFIAHPDYAPRRLYIDSSNDWVLEELDIINGPYLDTNITATTISASATSGSVTLSASSTAGINNGSGFTSDDIGRFIKTTVGTTVGYAEITAVASTTSVTATVKSAFGATTAVTTWSLGLYSEKTGYPSVVGIHQNRLVLAGSKLQPERVDLSATDFTNTYNFQIEAFSTTDPILATFAFDLYTDNRVFWLSSSDRGLVVGTADSEFLLSTPPDGLSPSDAPNYFNRVTSYGSADISPQSVASNLIFIQTSSRRARSFVFSDRIDNFDSQDLSILSEQALQGGVNKISYQREPQPVVWMVRNDGQLIGMTYQSFGESTQAAFHRHIIGGPGDAAGSNAVVESITTVPSSDGTANELWLIVKRFIDGSIKRYIEFLEAPFSDSVNQKDAFFVDSGLTYDLPIGITGITAADPAVVTANSHGFSDGDKVLISGVIGMTDVNGESYLVSNSSTNTFELQDLDGNDIDASSFSAYVSGGEVRKYVTTISNLNHLEGATVSVLADGAVRPDKTVTNGTIVLNSSATTVHVGFSFRSRAKLLRMEAGAGDGTSMGKTRRINRIGFMLHRSLGLKVGESFNRLTTLTFRTASDSMTRAPSLFTGIRTENVDFSYDFDNNICFEQEDPLPLTILAVMPQLHTQDR